MRANEHYAANLRGVNAQLRAQRCPSNQNTGGSKLIGCEAIGKICIGVI